MPSSENPFSKVERTMPRHEPNFCFSQGTSPVILGIGAVRIRTTLEQRSARDHGEERTEVMVPRSALVFLSCLLWQSVAGSRRSRRRRRRVPVKFHSFHVHGHSMQTGVVSRQVALFTLHTARRRKWPELTGPLEILNSLRVRLAAACKFNSFSGAPRDHLTVT